MAIMALLRRPIVVVGIVIALLVVTFAYAGDLTGWNTTGEEQGRKGWEGRVRLTASEYVTSWKSGGQSEMITSTFAVQAADLNAATLTHYRLEATVEGTMVKQYPADGTFATFNAAYVDDEDTYYDQYTWSFTLEDIIDGRLKIQAYAKGKDWGGITSWGPSEFGWDGAYLKSGNAQISLYGDQGPFAEGDSAKVFVKTGFTKGEGWIVKLYPPADRTDLSTVQIQTLADDQEKIVSIPVKAGYFKVGSSNEFKAELWNNYFDIGFTQIFAVDSLDRIPIVTDSKLTVAGATATVTLEGQSTFRPISKFRYWAWYGEQTMPSVSDTESWVKYAQDVTATSTGGTNYTGAAIFDVKSDVNGWIQIKIVAYDDEGRTSEPVFYAVKAENGVIEDTDTDPLDQPFLWTNAVYLMLIMGALFGAIAAALRKGRLLPRILLFVGIFIIFAVAAYVVGSTPDLAFILG